MIPKLKHFITLGLHKTFCLLNHIETKIFFNFMFNAQCLDISLYMFDPEHELENSRNHSTFI